MLIVALPLQFAHKFHHTEFNIGENGHVTVGIRCEFKFPDKGVLVFADKIACVGTKPVFLRHEVGISHTVGGFPLIGFNGGRFGGGAKNGVAVLYICIETRTVGRQMEKPVVVNSPYLRRFIKRYAAARL